MVSFLTFWCSASCLRTAMEVISMSTYMYVASAAKATITVGKALCTCIISSCSVSVAGIQDGRELSVRHREISNASTPIPKIAIHVLEALAAIGIVRMYVETIQYK